MKKATKKMLKSMNYEDIPGFEIVTSDENLEILL